MYSLINITGIAYAQTAEGVQGGATSSLMQIAPIILMIAIFYFLLIRPQQKKEKDRKAMISQIQKGDRVLTAGGMYGDVDSIKDEEVVVLKLVDGSKAEFSRNAITMKVL